MDRAVTEAEAVLSDELVAGRLDDVWRRIERAGGDSDRVRIVAVTKGFGPDAVRAAGAAGIADVGESYAQELTAKAGALDAGAAPRWHFIGRLQSNKVRALAPLVATWQSVDRPSLVDEVARRAPGATVFVQVDVTDEDAKGGCRPDAVEGLVAYGRAAGLEVAGLMAVGRTGPPEAARPGFRLLRALADGAGVEGRSMGMSGDLEVAVEEGATMVRLGAALFGARPPRQVATGADSAPARR